MNWKDKKYYFNCFKHFCQATALCAVCTILIFLLVGHHNGIEPFASIAHYTFIILLVATFVIFCVKAFLRYIDIKNWEKQQKQAETKRRQEMKKRENEEKEARRMANARNQAKKAHKAYTKDFFNELNKI